MVLLSSLIFASKKDRFNISRLEKLLKTEFTEEKLPSFVGTLKRFGWREIYK